MGSLRGAIASVVRRIPYFALLFVAACTTTVPHLNVQTLPPSGEDIPPGYALVVFARTQKAAFGNPYGPTQPFFLVDERGALLGELPADSRLHVVVPAGVHTFVGWHHAVLGDYGDASLVTGTLTAGRAYYVAVGAFEYPMQMISEPLALSQIAFDGNGWSWQKGRASCGTVRGVLSVRRVAPAAPGSAVHPLDKVRSQIEEAKEAFSKRQRDGVAENWKFHDRGGTFEGMFVDSRRAAFEELYGQATCERLVEAGMQEISPAEARAWEKTYERGHKKIRFNR